jgi:hypothetical protein
MTHLFSAVQCEDGAYRLRVGAIEFTLDRDLMLANYHKVMRTEILFEPGSPVTLVFDRKDDEPVILVIPCREVECVIVLMKRAIESSTLP